MKKYILKNLDCAGCAAKIETTLKKLDSVKSVSIDFSSLSMFIDIDDIDIAIKTIKEIEPDIEIIEPIKHKKEENNSFNPKKELFFTAICLLVFATTLTLSFLKKDNIYLNSVFIIVYFATGWKVLYKAFLNIKKGIVFDENFLMTIATLGAIVIGEYPEAAGVMLFYKIGTYLQELSIHRSRKSIKSLLEIRPDYAHLVIGDEIHTVSPDDVVINNEIIVKPGEKIPLDGEVIQGHSQVDTSALTGESVPRNVKENDSVLAGMINKTGQLRIKVTKLLIESSISKILELVENATHKKAATETFFTSFAKVYTPIIVILALLTAFLPPYIIDLPFPDSIYRALVLLVISCPCALVVSIPLTYFGGIGGASKKGILIKGSSILDTLLKVNKIVFDKTGTLTEGTFKVTKIKPFNSFTEDELLKITAEAESFSNHPIAQSILQAYSVNNNINSSLIQEISGQGISATINDKNVLVGNAKLMTDNNINFQVADEVGTVVYTTIDNIFAGYIIISDKLKDDTFTAIQSLKRLGIKNLSMLSGDNDKIASYIANSLRLSDYHANLLPEEKVEKLEKMIEKNNKLIYVGDGINDAPVIAMADVGIAMGALGSDAAIDTADVVIMNDSLTKISDLINISKKTRIIITQNIAFALSVKVLFIVLGIHGVAGMWEAVFADVGVTLLAVLNASRMHRRSGDLRSP